MIVDTSAVLAVVFDEPDSEQYDRAIAQVQLCRMSAANFLEATIALGRRTGDTRGRRLDDYLQEAGIELEPVTVEQAQAARRAWRRFGKGNHPAALNYGDCFAYALAEVTQEPLLFKGEDFARTDVEIWEGELIPIRSDYAANHMTSPPSVIPAKAGIQRVRSARIQRHYTKLV